MSWQDESIYMLRVLINDIDSSNYTYSDASLTQVLLVSANYVNQSVDFINDYTVSIQNESISPDPTEDPKDPAFINLLVLKSACFILGGEMRTSANNSISVTDGPSTINMGGVFSSIKDANKYFCDLYDKARIDHYMASNLGQVISTPFTNENLSPRDNFY